MAISFEDAERITRRFVERYPAAKTLYYSFESNRGKRDYSGVYVPGEVVENGKTFQGQVSFNLDAHDTIMDFSKTLRHELLGHFAINTFSPGEKRAIIDAIILAKDDPASDIKPIWDQVDRVTGGMVLLEIKAEEVYATLSEKISHTHHVGIKDYGVAGKQAFLEACAARTRLITQQDIGDIAVMVAGDINAVGRTQLTFPDSTPFYKKEDESMDKKPFHEVVSEKIIEQLKQGTAPWQKPWEPGTPSLLPMNPTTGNRYKGINSIILSMSGYSDNRWVTYNQASGLGAQVRKGESGTTIQYWKYSEEKVKTDEQGNPVFDADGKKVKVTVRLERPKVFYARVFNAEQIEGMPPLEQTEQSEQVKHLWESLDEAETMMAATGADILHSDSNTAYYNLIKDIVSLPEKTQFDSPAKYYATALHELGHWTGHPSRLDRDLGHPFGSKMYAKEELRAEISSTILGQSLGIGHDPAQHVAYVKSWVSVLQDDPMEIFRASADAEKIMTHMEQLTQTRIKDREQLISDVTRNLIQNFEALKDTPDISLIHHLGHRYTFSANDFNGNWHDIETLPDGNARYLRSINEGVESQRPEQFMRDVLSLSSNTLQIAGIESLLDNSYIRGNNQMTDKLNSLNYQGSDGELTGPSEPEAFVAGPLIEKSNTEERISSEGKRYIDVPYRDRVEVRKLGADFDKKAKSWFIPDGIDASLFDKWPEESKKVWLAVPYEDRVQAKKDGAMWDKKAKSWWVMEGADMSKLTKYLPQNVDTRQAPAMRPEEEFALALQDMGLVVTDGHPIMDGQKHRIEALGDKNSEKAGFYVGYLDGKPAGFIQNHRTGESRKWSSKGYSLDPAEKSKLRAEAAAKLAKREAEKSKLQNDVADATLEDYLRSDNLTKKTSYLEAKGINIHKGIATNKTHTETYIPAYDVDGKQWTMQTIYSNGTKRFAREGKKEGCFHAVGLEPTQVEKGLEALPVIVVTEGYATAATVTEVLGHAVIASFDSGNLKEVAEALHERYPDKSIIILGDNDHHLPMITGKNVGREKAVEAARAVGGDAIFPSFAPSEIKWPEDVPEITPESYRKHTFEIKEAERQSRSPKQEALLSDVQLSALAKIKVFTDFNDLYQKSKLGKLGAETQISKAVKASINKKIEFSQSQSNEVAQEPKKVSRVL